MFTEKTAGGTPAEPLEVLFFKKGSSIYSEGEKARHWYEVMRGTVRTCRFYADGHRQLTNFFCQGDVFGLDELRYRETAEAVTDVSVRRHGRSGGERFGEKAEREDAALRRALASAQKCIFLFGRKTAEQRIAAFLIGNVDAADPSHNVILPMPRADIADHLGLTIHTVSRTLSEMARRGLIRIDRRQTIRIVNIAGLGALSGDDEGFEPQGFDGHDALMGGGIA